jgi:type I restriction enzyme S subunit
MKDGWQTKKLGEICEIERGGSPRPIQNFITTDPKGINWIKIGDATASGKYIYKTEEKIKPDGVKRSRMVYAGDFILSNSMSFGRPYIMKTTGCIHDGWLVLHQPKVDPDYLYHVLSSDLVFSQFDRLAAGSTVRNLNIGLAKSVEIPYPPLPEQKRIVDILDEAFDGIATAKANTEKNLQNARALFESHLQAAFTQRGEGWLEKPLAELCEIKHGFAFKSKFFTNYGDYVMLTPGNFYESGGYRDRGDKQKYYCGEIPPGHVLKKGDMLIAMTEQAAGLLGSPILIPESDKFLHNQRLGLVTKKPGVPWTNEFFFHVFNTETVRKEIHDNASGVKVRHTSPTKIGEVLVSFPTSISEQLAIVSKLADLVEETQRLESIYQQKLAALDALKKSLLHQAFSGQL